MGRSRRHARTRLYTSKAFRCLPASRLLAADLVGSGLGASTSATELAAKTVPAMGEVIAFPTRLCWSHAHVWARPQHNTEWTGRGREFFSFSQLPRKDLPCTWGGGTGSVTVRSLQPRLSVSFLGTQTAPPPRATHLTKACAGHALSSRATTPAHDHATSPLHALHTALALSHEPEWPAVVEVSLETVPTVATIRDD
eukprot:scaffold55879_cov58-Phaeocystis_antarctica.AAC.3